MGGPWFLVDSIEPAGDRLVLPEEESHHALKVLRVSPPDVITVTDGKGSIARCAVSGEDASGSLVAEVLERHERRRPRPEIVVYQGASKGRKVDEVVEKLAELGVSEMHVYESSRSVVRWEASKIQRLADRWRTIARSAAKQSRSPFLLAIDGGISWTELVRRVAGEPFTVCLWEDAGLPLRAALVEEVDRVALVVGPEGGLSRDEADALADAGAQLVSLGPMILRTEMAPIVAAAGLLWHYGVIG